MAIARVVESDVCVIGAGITAAMVAEKLADERDARIVVVEAGGWTTPLGQRQARRQRFLAYGENPWTDDHLPGQSARGIISRSMVVGGWSMHWGGASPRYTPEDFGIRSLYGVGDDWPISYEELEPYYQDAEERIGIAGEPGPPELDVRSKPYPMPPLPMSYNLQRLKEWGESTGVPFWTAPAAKTTVPYRGRQVCARCDTCHICPTGAKYTPDFTFQRLIETGRIELLPRTLVRRLELEDGSTRIDRAVALDRDRPDEPVELRARTFVLACGYMWIPHLLLLSANSRYPAGLANSSGLVGKYMNGHRALEGYIELPMRLYPGIFRTQSLITREYERTRSMDRYVRHDLRISASSDGREPRVRSDAGEMLLGDEVMDDWRARTQDRATAYVRAIYDVLPDRDSAVTLEASRENRWGDPLPRIDFRDSVESTAVRDHTEQRIRALFEEMARAGDGRVLRTGLIPGQHHPGGGCRMGTDAGTSVTDSYGRTHDHENLFVVGGATAVTSGCTNSTLTFAALSLRSAEEIARELPARTG